MTFGIAGLSPADELSLLIEAVKEGITPKRCPKCERTGIAESHCGDGFSCGYSCGGGGLRISCVSCGHTITESECEEAEA